MIVFSNEACKDHWDKVVSFAKRNGLIPQLCNRLDMLGRIARSRDGAVSLYKDFAPMSFTFLAGGVHGGLIYSGPLEEGGGVKLDGGFPALTVSLGDPSTGWSIHT